MTTTHRAQVQSEHYSYEGYGSSGQGARDALLAGLRRHAAEMNTATNWPDEMLCEATTQTVTCGCSLFDHHDLTTIGEQVAGSPAEGTIAWRAYCDFRSDRLGWGYVYGYGSSEDEARRTVVKGIDAMSATNTDYVPNRDSVLQDIETYELRVDGAYRGGMVCGAGEPLLDGHLPPVLPEGATEWLPSVHCSLSLSSRDAVVASASAISRPTRNNRVSFLEFLEGDLTKAGNVLIDAVANPDMRDEIAAHIEERLPELAVKALFTKRGEAIREEKAIDGGLLLVMAFEPRPTTAASLVLTAE